MSGGILRRLTIRGVLWASLFFLSGYGQALAAGTTEEFFRGKTITWIASSNPGSGVDLFSRTIAPFLGREIGARAVRVENMKPDEGLNYLYRQGTRDGLTMGVHTVDATVGNDILKAPGVLYEADKFNFLANLFPSIKVLQISPKLPYRSLEAFRKAKGLRGGGTSAKGSLALSSAVISEILGLDSKVITGFEGKKSVVLALTRGEVDFMVADDTTLMRDEKDGFVVSLLAAGAKRSPCAPHAPALAELGVKIPRELETVYEFAMSGGTALMLPPGVPPERVEHLRKIFQKFNSNKELQKTLEKLTGDWRPFIPGEELQEEMAAVKGDKELAIKLDAIFKKYSAVR